MYSKEMSCGYEKLALKNTLAYIHCHTGSLNCLYAVVCIQLYMYMYVYITCTTMLMCVIHPIIQMWSPSPSVFLLLTNQIRSLSTALASEYPAIHYALLYALLQDCRRYVCTVMYMTILFLVSSPSIEYSTSEL